MDYKEKINKYVDLTRNGRLFPSYIDFNMKKYQLEEILNIGSGDPCNSNSKESVKEQLRAYQLFASQYISYDSPYRSILMFHFPGAGKTASVIQIYNALYNYSPAFNVFILLKASLKNGWLKELELWLSQDEYNHRFKNIYFISYDSPVAHKSFMDVIKTVDSAKKSVYIIDEVHNFIRNVYSNVTSEGSKRAQKIYDYIVQDRKENPDTRVICISATPCVNYPFELALLFNLLRPGIFPKSENEFNQLFISGGHYQTINKMTKNMFQRRIMGLVSYYIGATPDRFATKTIYYVDVQMSQYQEEIYAFYEDIEAKLAIKNRQNTVYKVYTRQACNFVFPAISQNVNGELRPRPGKFRLNEKDANRIAEKGNVKDANKETFVSEYKNAIELFIKSFKNYLKEKDDEDKNANHTILNDVTTFLGKYNGNYKEFHTNEVKKSKLYQAMWVSSAKMLNMIFNILMSPGPVLVYSNYVLMEGLEIFKVYLNLFGFYNFMDKMAYQEGSPGYTEFHGNISVEKRFEGMKEFNKSENRLGKFIKIKLVSSAGAEGLNLMNVRQVHIMEPYWNEVRITQMIGRSIRQCSHKELAMDQRHVNVYRYRSIRKDANKMTTDLYIEDVARSKEGLIQSFLDAVKEVAVDCNLFRTYNMITQEYKCFQFNEISLFDKQVGPAYREDIGDDIKMDNGSNSTRSITMRVKVMKIKAVTLLSPPDIDPPEYSMPEAFWMYSKTGVVYDYDLHFAVGKIETDENGLLMKLDKDTYIINQVIPIPRIVD